MCLVAYLACGHSRPLVACGPAESFQCTRHYHDCVVTSVEVFRWWMAGAKLVKVSISWDPVAFSGKVYAYQHHQLNFLAVLQIVHCPEMKASSEAWVISAEVKWVKVMALVWGWLRTETDCLWRPGLA